MTLLKFTFIHGIEIIIAIEFIIIYFVYWLGNRQHRKDYEKDYNYLKFLVDESDDKGPLMRKEIKRRFDEISTYSCRNYEKLQVLERTFDKKFANKKIQKSNPEFTQEDADDLEDHEIHDEINEDKRNGTIE